MKKQNLATIFSLSLLSLSVWTGTPTPAQAEILDSEVSPYIRLGGSAYRPTLDVAVRELRAPDRSKPDIWLTGAVHIGERAYYQSIQKFLDGKDLVLFECASQAEFEAYPATDSYRRTEAKMDEICGYLSTVYILRRKLPASLSELRLDLIRTRNSLKSAFLASISDDEWGNPIKYTLSDTAVTLFSPGPGNGADSLFRSFDTQTLIQRYPLKASLHEQLADAVGLKFQLREIRYDRKHFEHCDISLDVLRSQAQADSDREKAEAFKEFDTFLNFQNHDFIQSSLGLMSFFPGAKVRVRSMLIEQLSSPAVTGLGKNSLGKLLISDRNRVILKRLHEIDRQTAKNVAVFYGAAHLPEIEETLRREGYTLGETYWINTMDADLLSAGLPPFKGLPAL